MRAAYPPAFWEAYERLKAGDAGAADYVIDFLEADPICFRSGYLKADLLRFLGRIPLTEKQMERLRAVVLGVTARRDGRELRQYRQLARIIDAPSLQERLRALLEDDDARVRRRASWILGALDGKAGRSRN